MHRVENLKKITLIFQAGTSADTMDIPLTQPEFTFVFGLAPEGMTPFEYELFEKSEGEEVLLKIRKNSLGEFFEHIAPPIYHLFGDYEEIFINVKVVDIRPVENREIVKAMADMTAHGGGCDCGGSCGCGLIITDFGEAKTQNPNPLHGHGVKNTTY